MAVWDFNKIDFNRKIRMGLGFSLFVLAFSSFISFYSIQKLIDQARWVDHTNEVMLHLEKILSTIRLAETLQRGYLLTGKNIFLESYNGTYKKTLEEYEKVKKLTADNSVQGQNLTMLKPIIEVRLSRLEIVIRSFKKERQIASQALVEGSELMYQCEALVARMQAEEIRLLKIRRRETEKYSSASPIIIAVSSIFALLVSIFSFYFISKDIVNKQKIQTQLIAFNDEISKHKDVLSRNNYLLAASAKLNDLLRGENNLKAAGEKILSHFCETTKAQAGIFYVLQNEKTYQLVNSYACKINEHIPASFNLGEDLLGQCALEKKLLLLENVAPGGIRINSGLSAIEPVNILIVPFHHGNDTVAVIELLSKEKFETLHIDFIEKTIDTVSIFINSLKAQIKTQTLLVETQTQSEELQTQQEELRQMNEELEEQTQNLQQQHEELQVANEELEHQSQSIELKNKELEKAQVEIERKTKDLENSSRYKSEFLANMSHELRTPLNSLLILSKDLADNKKKNLEEFQVESAQIIYNSGKDLLQLINEVLDLSKIEAGKMDLVVERLEITALAENINRNFKYVIHKKDLQFNIILDKDIPEIIHTDRQRLDQIFRNLISNAIKFTQQGSITMRFKRHGQDNLAIDVSDTGIGIPEEKQKLVFEAFQQAEGGTSRKYGGTGLGLSISKELAKLIGGYILLQSKVNEGSTFTLVIPFNIASSTIDQNKLEEPLQKPATYHKETLSPYNVRDDREQLGTTDHIILLIEDDEKFAGILVQQAREKNFKVIATNTGEEGLILAQKYLPHAIILDLTLPGMNGKTVLSELKNNPSLRHIPVHIISASDRTIDTIKGGAVEYLKKPINREALEEAFLRMENFINRKMKNLLIIEDDPDSRRAIKLLIGNGDVQCFEAATGAEAFDALKQNAMDCIVLDLGLPDISGFELIKKLNNESTGKIPPIIVYTGRDLTKVESDELMELAETIIIKGVKSEERLLDETALFLHRTIENFPEDKRKIITELYDKETIFANKKVLLVDDDMRNIFALSNVLKEAGVQVVKAENGQKALEALETHPDTNLVLMDIMMPEMDGYEAMKRIRLQNQFKDLPIIALTAKAMKEDRSKCIDAGANDYISKPLDVDRLLSLMRVWIKKTSH